MLMDPEILSVGFMKKVKPPKCPAIEDQVVPSASGVSLLLLLELHNDTIYIHLVLT
jgi:hypothetical protein